MDIDAIHASEIWTKTQCLGQETQTKNLIVQRLSELGYQPVAHDNPTLNDRVFQKNKHRVVVCLVDDIRTHGLHYDYPYIFSKNTTLITDNRINCPTQYQVIRVPNSFFGIYSYIPGNQHWQPERDFSYSINRIDTKRLELFLDIASKKHLHRGYMNFNCEIRKGEEISVSSDHYITTWNQMEPGLQKKYQSVSKYLQSLMPLRNYKISHDDIHIKSYLNIIVETYHSNTRINSLSEKIFRALVTPVPWTVYAAPYTIAWLDELGFDTLRGLVRHETYDGMIASNKTDMFVDTSLNTVAKIKKINFSKLKHRCVQAATHNQKLLASMQKNWKTEFPQWLDNLPNLIHNYDQPE